jgi:hypothetical protein
LCTRRRVTQNSVYALLEFENGGNPDRGKDIYPHLLKSTKLESALKDEMGFDQDREKLVWKGAADIQFSKIATGRSCSAPSLNRTYP